MRVQEIAGRISRYSPITFPLVLFIAFLIPAFLYIRHLSTLPESSYGEVFSLLLTVIVAGCTLILALGFLTAFVAFLLFRISTSGGNAEVNLRSAGGAVHDITIQPCFKPLFGFISVRLLGEGLTAEPRHVLTRPSLRNLFSRRVHGRIRWMPENIGEFRIKKVIVYFEDWFRFFSFPVTVQAATSITRHPAEAEAREVDANPRRTEEETIRIEELRKVEGELVHYKHFESNDDVRRIVWKIYARNKDLVVRVPEILDPFASHLYMCVSFHAADDSILTSTLPPVLLDHYKTYVWTIYAMLREKGYEIKFVTDAEAGTVAEKDAIRGTVTRAQWQRDNNLQSVLPRDAAVVVISSLNDPEEVESIANNAGVRVVFVRLTEALRRSVYASWLEWLFYRQEGEDQGFRALLRATAIRGRLRAREKKLDALLKKYDNIVTADE
jgi:hypothetical protein